MQSDRSLQKLTGHESLRPEPSSIPDDPYLLAPLDLQRESIRLVKLLPSSDTDNIRCDMRSYVLNDTCPPYIALSYKWGHEPPKDSIVLNGTVKPVRHNLWAFLNRMRLRGIFETFWIDALCINQADIKERNHQVQMMKSIYSGAQSVSIWLGETEQDSKLHRAMSVLKSWDDPTYRSHVLSVHSASFPLWQLKPLYDHGYWRRMWIIQEVFHARHATIYCGSSDASLSTFEQVIADAPMLDGPSAEVGGHFHSAPAVGVVQLRRNGEPEQLMNLMPKFQEFEAVEIRDRVYALHAVCEEAAQMTIDYSVTREELFAQVMEWGNIELGYNGLRRLVARMLELEWSEADPEGLRFEKMFFNQ